MRTKREHIARPRRRGVAVDPAALVFEVCRVAGTRNWIGGQRRWLRTLGIPQALRSRNPSPLFDWLMGGLSYQGVSDAAAEGYIAAHGNVTFAAVEWR